MELPEMIAAAGPLGSLHEDIARALFNYTYGAMRPANGWDYAKIHEQWVAIGLWEAAGAVLEILPLDIKVRVNNE